MRSQRRTMDHGKYEELVRRSRELQRGSQHIRSGPFGDVATWRRFNIRGVNSSCRGTTLASRMYFVMEPDFRHLSEGMSSPKPQRDVHRLGALHSPQTPSNTNGTSTSSMGRLYIQSDTDREFSTSAAQRRRAHLLHRLQVGSGLSLWSDPK
jgi:hypothetical protein